MISQQPCELTTGENIASSLQAPTTSAQQTSALSGQKRRQDSGRKTGRPERMSKKAYTVADLPFLFFRCDGQVSDAKSCPAAFFDAFIERYVNVSNVDRAVWPPKDRRNVINVMKQFASENGLPFPFQFNKDKF